MATFRLSLTLPPSSTLPQVHLPVWQIAFCLAFQCPSNWCLLLRITFANLPSFSSAILRQRCIAATFPTYFKLLIHYSISIHLMASFRLSFVFISKHHTVSSANNPWLPSDCPLTLPLSTTLPLVQITHK